MNSQPTPNDRPVQNPLRPEEQRLLEELQQLAAAGREEVDPEVIARAAQTLRWSFEDPESLVRAAYFMAHDPFQRREVESINAEFAAAEADGLEDY